MPTKCFSKKQGQELRDLFYSSDHDFPKKKELNIIDLNLVYLFLHLRRNLNQCTFNIVVTLNMLTIDFKFNCLGPLPSIVRCLTGVVSPVPIPYLRNHQ